MAKTIGRRLNSSATLALIEQARRMTFVALRGKCDRTIVTTHVRQTSTEWLRCKLRAVVVRAGVATLIDGGFGHDMMDAAKGRIHRVKTLRIILTTFTILFITQSTT